MKLEFFRRPVFVACFVAMMSLLGALGSGFIARQPESPAFLAQAPGTAASSIHGRQLFVQSCAHCHGDDARGNGEDGDGPTLYRLSIGNARIAAVVRKGIPDEMPSFVKKHGAQDIADLTAYLRSLQ